MERYSREDHIKSISKASCYTYLLIVCGFSVLFLLTLLNSEGSSWQELKFDTLQYRIQILNSNNNNLSRLTSETKSETGNAKDNLKAGTEKSIDRLQNGNENVIDHGETNDLSSSEFIGSNWKEEYLPKFANPKKYFIYQCPCHGLCGGFADREKGMVAAYIISLLSNRTFGLEHKCPGDISKYLRPNKVNWNIDKSRLHNLRQRRHAVIDNWGYMGKTKTMNFNQYYREDVIYWTGNNNYIEALRTHPDVPRLIPWMQNMSTCDVYKAVLNVLFTPTDYLKTKISAFAEKVASKPLVCAQIRIGKNPSIPSDGVSGRFVKEAGLKKVWNYFTQNVKGNSKLFIATDSMAVKTKARSLFSEHIVDIPGPIIHVDRGVRGNGAEGFMKVVLDQLILSHCSKLIVSKSGFSFIGAYLRPDSKNLYIISNGNLTATRREDLLKFYPM